jgi:hypothetical protein
LARLSNNDQQAQLSLYIVNFLGSPQSLSVNTINPDVLRTFLTLYASWISIFVSILSKHILSEYHSILYTDINLYGYNVISEVRWRDFEVRENQVHTGRRLGKCQWMEVKGTWSREEIEYFQEQGLECDKWSEGNLKWGEEQLNVVKGRELRWVGMWSTYKGSEVEWGVYLGKMCVTEYCIGALGLAEPVQQEYVWVESLHFIPPLEGKHFPMLLCPP